MIGMEAFTSSANYEFNFFFLRLAFGRLLLAFSSHIKSDNDNLTEPWAAADTNK